MKFYALDRSTAVTDYRDRRIIEGLTPAKEFDFRASRHEYYVVQLILDPEYDMRSVAITTGALENASGGKPVERAVTCFNAGGVNVAGEKFTRKISVSEGVLQPLLFGIDLSRADVGKYFTVVTVGSDRIRLNFVIDDELVFSQGTENGNTRARLKWLNSSLCSDKKILSGYEAISVEKNALGFTGKKALLGNDGLIENVESRFGESNALTDEVQQELFYRPMEFLAAGQKFKYNKLKIVARAGTATLTADGRSEKLRIDVSAEATYEGALRYEIKLTADSDVIAEDVCLKAYFKAADLFSGLGVEGGKFTDDVAYKRCPGIYSDALFIGNVNCGARLSFGADKGASAPVYGRFAYYENKEDEWYNFGKGGVNVVRTDDGAELTAYTGKTVFTAGAAKKYRFTLHLTPFKPLDLANAFSNRFAGDRIAGNYGEMLARAETDGMKYLDLQYNGELNRCANSPFDGIEALKDLALEAHKRKIGLAIAYTPGAVSADSAEACAFHALGDEVLLRSRGSAEDYSPCVLPCVTGAGQDGTATLLTVPGSRAENYYVEGVNYLINNADLNAISMSDPTLTRNTAERVAKCVKRKRGIEGLVEIGFRNRFNEENGYAGALNAYADILPFADKLYATDADVTRQADRVLTEVSGIPYGLNADCRYDASICRSLLFGMLPRYGEEEETSAALADLNAVFAGFDMSKAEMKGYWDHTNPVRVDTPTVRCTCYIDGGNMLVAIYNENSKATRFEIGIENKLGFTTVGKRVYAPGIVGLQKKKRVNFNKPLRLAGHRGIIVVVREKKRAKAKEL